MTLTTIKPSTISLTKGIVTMTIETAIAILELSPKAIAVIAQMKAVLINPELIAEYVQRVINHPSANKHCKNGYASQVLHIMRKEQLQLNPMSDELMLDMYLLNPLQALSLYFKEHITPYQVERMNKWGINIKDLIAMKQRDNNIRFDHATMQFA